MGGTQKYNLSPTAFWGRALSIFRFVSAARIWLTLFGTVQATSWVNFGLSGQMAIWPYGSKKLHSGINSVCAIWLYGTYGSI